MNTNKSEQESKSIIEMIYPCINPIKILPIIMHNKKIQKKLNITINDYKKASNAYIIKNEEENITKIYRKGTDDIIFSGKYLYGIKYEGIEYKDNKEYYIGEYKNNLKYKGKTLNKNGKIIYEGEYKEGLYWNGCFYNPSFKITGKIKEGYGNVDSEYDFQGNKIFKGKYKDGKRISGIEYNINNKKIFEGEYKGNNIRWNGYLYSFDDKIKYEIKEGYGIIKEYDYDKNIIYEGEYKYGIRYNGKGKEYYKNTNILKYEGIYEKGYYKEGIYYYNKNNMNDKFIGKFINGIIAEGLLYKYNCDNFENIFYYGKFKEGKKYEGIQINDISGFIGNFDENENYKNGKYYIGDYNIIYLKELLKENKLKELKEDEVKQNGELKFNGIFKDGLFYKGKEYNFNQSYGFFKKYNKRIYDGEYNNGNYWNGKGYKIKDLYSKENEGFFGTYEKGKKKGEEILYDDKGNLIIEKKYFNKYDYDYKYYNKDEIIEGKLIEGFGEHIFEFNIIYVKEKFLPKKIKIVYKAFEGKYKDNKRYHGKEYDRFGNVIFEGDYLDGNYLYGKKYSGTNNQKEINCLLFEGEFKDGKYYKGKEYYNINEIENKEDYKYENEEEYENILYFEGLYENGKKYKGWEYNYNGELIYSGNYKSGLYWDGYFYNKGPITKQKKSGQIIKGKSKIIEIYDKNGKIIYKGDMNEGKYYNGKGILIKEEYGEIKDIDVNNPHNKKIKKITIYDGKYEKGIFIDGNKKEEYIIDDKNEMNDDDELETFI